MQDNDIAINNDDEISQEELDNLKYLENSMKYTAFDMVGDALAKVIKILFFIISLCGLWVIFNYLD